MKQTGSAWYCLRAAVKRELFVAKTLKAQLGLEVYLPRIRHRKATIRGPVLFTDALFPGYVFVRFDLNEHLTRVRSMHGITSIVNFNGRYQSVPDKMIQELKSLASGTDILVVNENYPKGGPVRIVEGSLKGLEGMVQQYLPGRERIIILMKILGREAEVTLPVNSVLPDKAHRLVR